MMLKKRRIVKVAATALTLSLLAEGTVTYAKTFGDNNYTDKDFEFYLDAFEQDGIDYTSVRRKYDSSQCYI